MQVSHNGIMPSIGAAFYRALAKVKMLDKSLQKQENRACF